MLDKYRNNTAGNIWFRQLFLHFWGDVNNFTVAFCFQTDFTGINLNSTSWSYLIIFYYFLKHCKVCVDFPYKLTGRCGFKVKQGMKQRTYRIWYIKVISFCAEDGWIIEKILYISNIICRFDSGNDLRVCFSKYNLDYHRCFNHSLDYNNLS